MLRYISDKSEVTKKDEAPQSEVDNMNKLNTSPEETEDSTSRNQSASVTAVEIKVNPPTPGNVTLMDDAVLNSTLTSPNNSADNNYQGLYQKNATSTD